MATLQTALNRPAGDSHATGKAYFETSTNKFIVWNGSSWLELHSDGIGSAPFLNRWGASFDGTSQFLNGNSVDSALSSTAFTYSVWFKIDPSLVGIHCILAQDTGYSGGSPNTNRGVFFLYDNSIGVSNRLGSSVYGGGVTEYKDLRFNELDTVDNDWHHFALSCNVFGDSYIAYLDGSSITPNLDQDGPNGAPTSLYQNNLDLYIGGRELGGRNLKGSVDEVALFNYALTDVELGSLIDSSGANPVPANISSLTPSAWWRMGDDSNDSPSSDPASNSIVTITDSSGNGNDATQGTANNQPTFKALDQSTTSLKFDPLHAGDTYLDCGGANEFSFTDGEGNDLPFSISAWVKLDSTDRVRIASKDNGTSNREYLFGTNGANSGRFNMLLGTANVNLDVANTTTLNTTDWYHVVATYDGSKDASGLNVYVNGDASNQTDTSLGTYTGMTSNSGSFEIGRFGNGHSFFNGLIDEVAIFNTELSASDVASLAASRGAHIKDDLDLTPLAYYRMGEDDSLTDGQTGISLITDASGNENHATQIAAANQPTASVSPVIYV